MRKWFPAVVWALGVAAFSFLMEPMFPLGDWRWGVIAAVAFMAGAIPHWESIRARIGVLLAGVRGRVRVIRTTRHATIAVPERPQPDEQLVILCRRYALPAYRGLCAVIDDLSNQCFALGGWHGLSAGLLKRHVMPKADAAAENVNASIGGTREMLAEDLRELYWEYDALMGYAYHFGKSDLALDQLTLERWATRDQEFETRLADLAAGINRENLAPLTRPSETRGLLRSLRASK